MIPNINVENAGIPAALPKITDKDIECVRGLINSFYAIIGVKTKSKAKDIGDTNKELILVKALLRAKYPKQWTNKIYEAIVLAPYFIGLEFGLEQKDAMDKYNKSLAKSVKNIAKHG